MRLVVDGGGIVTSLSFVLRDLVDLVALSTVLGDASFLCIVKRYTCNNLLVHEEQYYPSFSVDIVIIAKKKSLLLMDMLNSQVSIAMVLTFI